MTRPDAARAGPAEVGLANSPGISEDTGQRCLLFGCLAHQRPQGGQLPPARPTWTGCSLDALARVLLDWISATTAGCEYPTAPVSARHYR
jgi:hypothetical protein